MKIISLQINDIRGIRDLSLEPNCKNLVIWGNNGSGKSAVVDALDFLLTGKMNRLTGKGTAGITLQKHGCHIDCEDLSHAYVSAKLELPSNKTVEIRRCLKEPTKLEHINGGSSETLNNILSLADRGQHVLTRREILKFVTAEGKTRSEEIQTILNISEIEEVRKSFVTVRNSQKRTTTNAKQLLTQSETDIQTTSDSAGGKFDKNLVVDFVNANRKILGAAEIAEINVAAIKNNIEPVVAVSNNVLVNPEIATNDFIKLNQVISDENLDTVKKAEIELSKIIQEILADLQNLLALKRKQLIDLGIEMLGDGSDCPLCDSKWKKDELRKYLEEKAEKAEFVEKHKAVITKNTQYLISHAQKICSSLRVLAEYAKRLGLTKEQANLDLWQENLKKSISLFESILDKFDFDLASPDLLSAYFSIENLPDIREAILKKANETLPKVSEEQTAWDNLTRLEENLRGYIRSRQNFEVQESKSKQAQQLYSSFEQARDEILQGLYDEIRGTFEKLYKELHGSDEADFASELKPSGAGIKFEVDFYGREKHPPHAMHSEGHQDSMGLCLYLALSEKLTNGLLDIVILDDVVMSVDIEHRKQLCSVLLNNFPNKQFIITTHDQTWAQMLRHEKVVDRNGLKEFFNWTVETGPNVENPADLWESIDKDLVKNDVNGAAHKLRHGLERFFYEVCGRLNAQIRFKPGGRWDLGDLSDSSISSLNSAVIKAKKSAKSWGNTEQTKLIEQFAVEINEKKEATEIEKWVINPNVHYTNWMKLAISEFKSVVNAFHEFLGVFECQACSSLFYYTFVGPKPETFRCKCGKVNWSLNIK